MSLGPGIPDPEAHLPVEPQKHRHKVADNVHVIARRILGGLHHEYSLEKWAA